VVEEVRVAAFLGVPHTSQPLASTTHSSRNSRRRQRRLLPWEENTRYGVCMAATIAPAPIVTTRIGPRLARRAALLLCASMQLYSGRKPDCSSVVRVKSARSNRSGIRLSAPSRSTDHTCRPDCNQPATCGRILRRWRGRRSFSSTKPSTPTARPPIRVEECKDFDCKWVMRFPFNQIAQVRVVLDKELLQCGG